MKRTVLFALLGLSVAGNAWFLLARAREPGAAAPPENASIRAANTPAASASANSPSAAKADLRAAKAAETDTALSRGITWRTPTTDDEFRTLANDLRAAGFPPQVISRVVRELYQQRRRAESPEAKAPFWQRRAAQKEEQEYNRATTKALDDILGPDARRSASLDAVTRARQYGNLPDTKIDAIAAIERDYQDIQRDQNNAITSGEEWSARQQERTLIKAEMRADLEKILTPSELADYEMRNSDTARSLSHAVQNVSMNAAEFASLYEARRAFEAANPQLLGRVTMEQVAARQAAESAYFERARALLADDRFYTYLAATDFDFRNLSGLTKQFPTVTPAAAYQAFQLRQEVQQARNTLFGSGAANTPESVAATYASWNARLDALLGPDAAAVYRKTNYGRMFVAPTRRSVNRSAPPRG
jgi:hypothetical protein